MIDWDNRLPRPVLRHLPFEEVSFCLRHRHMAAYWRRPETPDEVIACNRIEHDLRRVVMLHEAWELDRVMKRSGF